MKRFLQSVTSILVALAMLAAPVAEAQTRGRQANGNRSGNSSQQSASRPSHSGGTTNYRHHNGGGSGNRPGGNHHGNSNNRPGGNWNQSKPGGHHRPEHRPSHTNDYRPMHRPGGHHYHQSHRPSYRPGYGPMRPPHRHHHGYRHPVPFFNGFHRPVPPPRWHYVSGGPTFGTILGIALGTAIGASLTALANNGYAVSSYGNDVIYMNDVPQMNYMWPDAALYYNGGVLCGSQFTCPTAYYDMSRYNALYNTFIMQYGNPVSFTNSDGIISSSWFGPSGRYVTLSFNSQYGNYYTTLSFGN